MEAKELVEAINGFKDAVSYGVPMSVMKGMLVFYAIAMATIIIRLVAGRGRK